MATLQSEGLQGLLNRLGVEDSVNSFPSADVLTRPLDIYRSHLAEVLVHFTDCEPQMAYASVQEPSDFGDLEVVIPKLRLKGSNPKELAFELAQKFPKTPLFDQPFEDGIHLRLYLSPENLARIVLPYILDRGKSYGSGPPPNLTGSEGPVGARRRVIVEFSSPNLGKEFDGAHLRSTIIGSSIASLYEGMGWDVCRLNFLGDWGKNIGLLAVGWSRFGSDELFEADPLRHLLTVYAKIDKLSKVEQLAPKETNTEVEKGHEVSLEKSVSISAEQDQFSKKMEEGDSNAIGLWKRLREVCVREYASLYAQLNISFDDYSGESEVGKSAIAEVEAALIEKGVYEDNNGTWIIDFKKHGSKGLGTVNARHPNGTTSYLLRDVGAVLERRKKYNFDKMIYVVSAKQDTHFQQLFRTLELMGDEYHELAQALQHVNFANVRDLSPQSGVSGLLLGDILEQSQKAMQASLKAGGNDGNKTLNDVKEFSRLALVSQELSTKRSNALNFTFGADEKIATLMEKYPGLKLQRWLDILRSKVQEAGGGRGLEHEDLDYTFFEHEEAYADMLRLIVRFPNIVKHAFEKLDPSAILSFLLQVTDMLPSAWDEDEDDTGLTETGIEDEDTGERSASGVKASSVEASQSHNTLKSLFYECVRTVLENGMNFIGLVPIKERGQDLAGVPEVTALPKEASEEATPAAIPEEVNKGALPTVIPEEVNQEAPPAAMPQGANEEAPPIAMWQEANEAPPLPIPQEVNKEAPLKVMEQEVDKEAPPTVMPQEVDEETRLSPMPQEINSNETEIAERREINEEAVDVTEPAEVNDEAGPTAIPQERKEGAAHTTTPQGINEDAAHIVIPQEDNEEPALTAIPQEMNEATPVAIPQALNNNAAPTTVPQELSKE